MTSDKSPKKYGVASSAFSETISVGKLSKDGSSFIDKEDLTAEVLNAVAMWVEKNHGSDAWVEVGGKRIDISVTDIDAPQGHAPSETDRSAISRAIEQGWQFAGEMNDNPEWGGTTLDAMTDAVIAAGARIVTTPETPKN